MTGLPGDDLTQLRAELETLRARTTELERERDWALQQRRLLQKRFLATLAGVGLVGVLGSGVAIAANGNCPNGLPYCFVADSPAHASEVNHNFAQLKEWLEQKVGPTGTPQVTLSGSVNAIRVQQGTTSNAATAGTKALFVSGNFGDGQSGNGGVEFRHDNLTQGVGIGYNTIYATGDSGRRGALPARQRRLRCLGARQLRRVRQHLEHSYQHRLVQPFDPDGTGRVLRHVR